MEEENLLHNLYEGPSLDLQLSISLQPLRPPESDNHVLLQPLLDHMNREEYTEKLKWQASKEIRLAALENSYAERVRELTKREMELAEAEFSRARQMWERAQEEIDKAEKLREIATHGFDPKCMQLTCQACSKKFQSY